MTASFVPPAGPGIQIAGMKKGSNLFGKIGLAGQLVALGIVFGDIGTSPLYVMAAVIGKHTVTTELVFGGLSCIFWTLTLQATIKYILFTLRADNHGEGGIFSLYTLIRRKAPRWTIYIAVLGCSALLADGIITPAISLTASVEGLLILSPKLPVEPIVLSILVGLFVFQQFGTERVGKSFGPIMVLWFSMLIFWGIRPLLDMPGILHALHPYYAWHILTTHPGSWGIVGAVFLCVTGAEALYSDLGHAGKKNIRQTWVFVKTALLINYFGQGAWLLASKHGQTLAGTSPFYALMPEWFISTGVFIAVLASVVASQALISGSFSLINEAIKLNTWFRVQIRYPSRLRQQLFIPFVNRLLFVGCAIIVIYFQKSSNMEAAYGIAITIAMLSTTLLLSFYFVYRLHWNRILAATITGMFTCVELVFFLGSLEKLGHGAWVSLVFMTLFVIIMLVHFEAKRMLGRKRRFVDVRRYTEIIAAVSDDRDIPKYASNIVYLTNARHPEKMEKQILKSIYQKQPKRADAYWLLHFSETESPFQNRYNFQEILPGKIFRLDFELGYKVKPNVREMFVKAIQELEREGHIDLSNRYSSLKKHHIKTDFLFIVMRNTFNLSAESPLKEVFILNLYKQIQKISIPPEQYLGIDRNALQVEYIALQ
ncbi:MAG: potassium transporter Kup [Bacteroidetes bacterium]|nr:MAG: potassium transporter Kup [Bacteroidota bacterium]